MTRKLLWGYERRSRLHIYLLVLELSYWQIGKPHHPQKLKLIIRKKLYNDTNINRGLHNRININQGMPEMVSQLNFRGMPGLWPMVSLRT